MATAATQLTDFLSVDERPELSATPELSLRDRGQQAVTEFGGMVYRSWLVDIALNTGAGALMLVAQRYSDARKSMGTRIADISYPLRLQESDGDPGD